MPVPSCPPEIAELMTQTVFWEPFLGFDGHAEPSYGPGIELTCWVESPSITGLGGVAANRAADETTVEPKYALIFNGDDPSARQIQLWDRFTSFNTASEGTHPLQATQVNTLHGPPFDNQNPWLIQVVL